MELSYDCYFEILKNIDDFDTILKLYTVSKEIIKIMDQITKIYGEYGFVMIKKIDNYKESYTIIESNKIYETFNNEKKNIYYVYDKPKDSNFSMLGIKYVGRVKNFVDYDHYCYYIDYTSKEYYDDQFPGIRKLDKSLQYSQNKYIQHKYNKNISTKKTNRYINYNRKH